MKLRRLIVTEIKTKRLTNGAIFVLFCMWYTIRITSTLDDRLNRRIWSIFLAITTLLSLLMSWGGRAHTSYKNARKRAPACWNLDADEYVLVNVVAQTHTCSHTWENRRARVCANNFTAAPVLSTCGQGHALVWAHADTDVRGLAGIWMRTRA